MMIVIDLIRGRGVEEALSMLHFFPSTPQRQPKKPLRSAISNLQSKDEGGRVDTGTMYVKEVFVNGGSDGETHSPAHGTCVPYPEASHHLTIVVATRETKGKRQQTGAPKAARGNSGEAEEERHERHEAGNETMK